MKLKTTFAIFLLCLPTSYLLAQTFTITGQVVDTKGYTLMGATVRVKGTVRGTSTDLDGRFSLEVSVGVELEFSFIGYQTQEFKITEKRKDFYIVLSDAEISIGCDLPVIVPVMSAIAPNIEERVSILPYPNHHILPKDFKNVKTFHILDALEGRIIGLNLKNNSIRGGRDNLLYVVNGIPMGQRVEDVAYLNPEDIQSIEVLIGASASSLYGGEAVNGVVVITTHKESYNNNQVNITSGLSFYNGSQSVLQNAVNVGLGGNYNQTYLSVASLQSGNTHNRYNLFAKHKAYFKDTPIALDFSGAYTYHDGQDTALPKNFYAFSGALNYEGDSDFKIATHFHLDNRSYASEKFSYYTDVVMHTDTWVGYVFFLHSHLGASYEREKGAVFGLTSLEFNEKAYLIFSARSDFLTATTTTHKTLWKPTIGGTILPHQIFQKLKKSSKIFTDSKLQGAYTWGRTSSYEIDFYTQWWYILGLGTTLYHTSFEEVEFSNQRLQTEGVEMYLTTNHSYYEWAWRNRLIASFNENEIGNSWRLGWQAIVTKNEWRLTCLLTSDTSQCHLQELSLYCDLAELFNSSKLRDFGLSLYHSDPPLSPKNTGLMLRFCF